MEPQVNLRVSCRGETQSFLVSDTAHTTWADVEAMVKVSFDLDDIQIKYIDEDNDEVSVNSKEEYEEALKIAVKQGNQLQMNVYEESSPLKETSSCSWQLHEKTFTEKLAVLKDELTTQFREQVVKETVEQLEQKLYEKLIHHNQSPDFSESSITTAPPNSETQTSNGNQRDWLISCCNCQARIVGVRYQCRSLSQHFQAIVPTLSAVFVDENLPDGTHLQPGTKFIKHWQMKNTGSVEWSSDTKVAFLCFTTVSRQEKTTSFGLDSYLKLERSTRVMGEIMEQAEISLPPFPLKMKNLPSEREFYIPSVDLLTAQELERVPHNTPVDMTPCMSPLPHDSLLLEKPGLGQIEEENEGSGFKPVPAVTEVCFSTDTCVVKMKTEHPLNQEEGEEDMSGTQFVCETVIRSLTLDAAPDHKPPQKKKSLKNSLQTFQDTFSCNVINEEPSRIKTHSAPKKESNIHQSESMAENGNGELLLSDGGTNHSSITARSDEDEGDDKDDVQSQGSSTSSEDYIIILPECFDTSRPLGESMYSSALSQPSLEKTGESETGAGNSEVERQPQMHSISNVLTTSQTIAVVPLAPEVVDTLPQTERNLASLQNNIFQEPNIPTSESVSSTPYNQMREESSGEDRHEPGSSLFLTSNQKGSEYPRNPQGGSIAGELVKGALSVAASAYKALFAGPPITEQPAAAEERTTALLSSLCEMGFCDRQLNLRLLKKHNNNMVQVVTELLQISNGDWYSNRC
ncbi:UNVERIFIED_CONTAM: hypothetical protein H355_015883 [Colinus virginianus]|nr:hypothetical protein H355_015883 [Colinus virginianus]